MALLFTDLVIIPQMQHYQRLSSNLTVLFLSFFLNSSCKKHTVELSQREYFGGAITMNAPANWKSVILPEAPLNDMHEYKPSVLVGKATGNSVLIVTRHQPVVPINAVSSSEVVDLYYKSSRSMKLLSVTTDSIENIIIIDYLGKRHFSPNRTFYLRHILIVQEGRWTSFDFQGMNTESYRDTVQQMTESIQIRDR